jgi:YrbI family 3-deoxy-D-manno-octulosonate 8-phosphate phosphatase
MSDDPALRSLIQQVRLVVFDFDGVFTDNAVYASQDGSESVRCWRGDGLGLRILEQLRISPLVLSTEENPVVLHRCRKLKVRCIHACPDKVITLTQVAAEMGLAFSQVAYLGNDINDEGCLDKVGLPMVVADAHPDVIHLAKYRTQLRGGYGAVREVCDLFKTALGAGH